MNKVNKIINILLILIIIVCGYIFIINKNEIIETFNSFLMLFKENEVIVPLDKTVNHRQYDYITVKETNYFKPNNIDDIKSIYYTVLNNGWEEFTFYCPKDYKECANDVKKVINNKEFLSLINNYVSPYNTYKNYWTTITNDKEINLKIEKLYTDDDIKDVNNKLIRIFNELNINNNIEENIKKLHDYLIENTDYDEEYENNNTETISNKANGLLFNHKALCSGYSDTLALMLDKLNIPNFKVSNDEHIWNVIYINNEWKHIDVTWDDDQRNIDNRYKFYLLTTDELLEKENDIHRFNRNIYLEIK